MKGERRSFTKEFKLMAVELFESGKSTKEDVVEVHSSLGVVCVFHSGFLVTLRLEGGVVVI